MAITVMVVLIVLLLFMLLYTNVKLRQKIEQAHEDKQRLLKSEQKASWLIENSPVLYDAFDENGKCTLWNKECEKVFGWTIEEINAHENTLALFYPDPKDQAAVIDSFVNIEFNKYREWHPVTKDGRKLTTLWANLKLPSGEVINAGLDVTELENAKAQLQKLNDTLQMQVKQEVQKNKKQQILMMEQAKFAQMGEMIQNIAHQWRQPLAEINSVVLLLDTLLPDSVKKERNIEKTLDEIEQITQYMSKTIDDFGDFFSKNKVHTCVNLQEMIDESLFMVKGDLSSILTKVVKEINPKFEFCGYVSELKQVIVIIVKNANDALREKKIENARIKIDAYEEDGNYTIRISDNGGGIEPATMTKIFDPYFTTKHQSKGRGIGLYMAKMIIEEGMQGKLSVRNKDDGAEFTIVLPKGGEVNERA